MDSPKISVAANDCHQLLPETDDEYSPKKVYKLKVTIVWWRKVQQEQDLTSSQKGVEQENQHHKQPREVQLEQRQRTLS